MFLKCSSRTQTFLSFPSHMWCRLCYSFPESKSQFCVVLESLWSSPPNHKLATVVAAPEINLAGVDGDGNAAENYGLLSDNEPCDYLPRESNIKPPKLDL